MSGVEPDLPSVFSAQCEPWLQQTLTGFGSGIRRPDSERVVGWVNYVPAGVVSAKQLTFTAEQVTQLCHSFPRTGGAVIFLPNRAGDLRTGSPVKQLGIFCIFEVCVVGFVKLNCSC